MVYISTDLVFSSGFNFWGQLMLFVKRESHICLGMFRNQSILCFALFSFDLIFDCFQWLIINNFSWDDQNSGLSHTLVSILAFWVWNSSKMSGRRAKYVTVNDRHPVAWSRRSGHPAQNLQLSQPARTENSMLKICSRKWMNILMGPQQSTISNLFHDIFWGDNFEKHYSDLRIWNSLQLVASNGIDFFWIKLWFRLL